MFARRTILVAGTDTLGTCRVTFYTVLVGFLVVARVTGCLATVSLLYVYTFSACPLGLKEDG